MRNIKMKAVNEIHNFMITSMTHLTQEGGRVRRREEEGGGGRR